MLMKSLTCPICENAVSDQNTRCPTCHCIIQFTLDQPAFSRAEIVEALVQATIDRCRSQISMNAQDGIAHYVLGLCYLNYALLDQGIEELRQATGLLPEKHRIRFELAVLQSVPGQYATALEQISLALRIAPESHDYQYLQHYLTGMTAAARREMRPTIQSWIAAFQLSPEASFATTALRQFIASHEAKLTQPIARALTGLDARDAEALKLLNSDPAVQKQALPRAPRAPGQLGKISLNLLRKVSPTRAAAVEQMHADRTAAYQSATVTYEAQRQTAIEQREATIKDWQARTQAIRSDLPTMARLCLAIFEEEERRRIEEERRRAEAEQRRQEAEQRRQAEQERRAQAQSAASTGRQKVREQQYLSTKAQYIQGLPKGKEKDSVNLTVTNLQITIAHTGMIGAWEYKIPMASLTEVAAETIKHLLSSEKRLRISYRDERGMVAHAIFADLKVDDCVNKILKARSGK